MSVVHGVGAAVRTQIPVVTPAAQGAAPPFAGVFQSMVRESSTLEKKAQDAVMGLVGGSGVELHEAMIATQKADVAFELGLQLRNKAVGAYQQMMNMQF